ncbi:MAG: hypothetical protein ACO20W_08285, partial [Anaerohalosphaeraceae bacterium]
MLTSADDLIEAGLYESALLTLQIIELKCDGQKSPEDFIEGPAAEELNTRVNELIDTLQQSITDQANASSTKSQMM